MNRMMAGFSSFAAAVLLVGSASAELPFALSRASVDLGEIPCGCSVMRQIVVRNLTDDYLPMYRVSADDGAEVQLLDDIMRPKASIPILMLFRVGDTPGPVEGVVRVTVGGVTNMTVDVRFSGRAVEGEPGIEYPVPRLDLPPSLTGAAAGARNLWTCPPRTESYLKGLRSTNRLEVARCMRAAVNGAEMSRSSRKIIVKMVYDHYDRVMREIFVQRKCTDEERDAALQLGIPGDSEAFAAWQNWSRELDRLRDAEERRLREEREAKLQVEREKQALEYKRRLEEAQKKHAVEMQARHEAEQKEIGADLFWRAVGLPGTKLAPVWKEYIEGDGRAYSDNEHFKTTVFMPFFVREFGLDRDRRFGPQLVSVLETEFADLVCHTGKSRERVEDFKANQRGEMNVQSHPEGVADRMLELWRQGCTNAFVLAAVMYGKKGLPCRGSTDAAGNRIWLMFYDLSGDSVPKGRDGLAARFFREATEGVSARRTLNDNYMEDRARALIEWCKALESEGAKPEQWRCVMLMTLRFLGRQTFPQANIQLADALEKANCAPILVRMLREEPVFSGNH